ncbi:site-specific DNA-methyltransferase [Campylobacter jejuni]|uniref:site-specific DNA-methyltransferase n=1 Tax=Campylobacter jejuni TaxID=197 RepID=UPI0011A174B3|nr:site-specific DNA-methyltransferase [Campylobacter jejuni]
MLDINKIKKENLINTKENKNELLEYLKLNFPQSIKDGQVDLKAIAMLLGLNNKEIRGYELSFTGKALANALYDTPNTKELKFHKSLSKDSQSTKNAIIKGDNLHALKLLKSAYYEKIKMIYIDPPYNTKNDKFIYNDDFVKEHKKLLIEVGLLEITEEGEEIRSEILNFFINIRGDRSHSAWLGFMLPRLKLARDLLREDGVIFISIDDNEQANLKILCDEIFGEENVETYIWNLSDFEETSFTKTASKTVRFEHEYIIACFKNIKYLGRFKEYRFSNREDFTNPDNDPRGAWMSGNISRNGIASTNGSKYYTITSPKGIEYTRNWTISKEEFDELIKDNRIFFSKNGEGVPRLKIFQNEESYSIQSSILSGLKTSVTGKKQIVTLFNKDVFSFPKPTFLIQRFLEITTCKTEDDIVLDFFAGSGTTAQAVMELNTEDNGNRKFILVQLDEKIDENKSKIAYDFCKNELGSENPAISDITIERVKRASEKILKENVDKNLDLGFKVFSLVEKPELTKDELNILNLKYHENLTPYEKALNLALLDGKTLDQELKMIIKDKLYQCKESFYVIKSDDEVLEFLRKTQNENVYINGYDDINLEDYLNLESFLKERLKVVY